MKFTWSDQKSIILTRVVVAGTIAGCGIMTVSGPWPSRRQTFVIGNTA